MKIGAKLGTGFGVLIIMLTALILVSVTGLNEVKHGYQEGVGAAETIKTISLKVVKDMLEARSNEEDFLREKDPQAIDQVNGSLDRSTAEVEQLVADVPPGELRQRIEKMNSLIHAYQAKFADLSKSVEEQGYNETLGLQGKFRDAVHKVEKIVTESGLDKAEILYLRLRKEEKDYMLRGASKYVERNHKVLSQLREAVTALPEERRGEAAALLDEYGKGFDALVAKDKEILDALSTMRTSAKTIGEIAQSVLNTAEKNAARETEAIEAAAQKDSRILWGTGIFSILFGIVFSWLFARSISVPLRRTVVMAGEIAQGDFSDRVRLQRKDEIGELASAMDNMAEMLQGVSLTAGKIADGDLTVNVKLASDKDELGMALQSMVSNLQELLGQIQVSGEQIASGSAQISDSSQSLSQGATESASSLEEISASLNEMTNQVRQSATNAGQASQLSKEAQNAADKGNTRMSEMVAAMHKISESSQSISKIIKVIDEIAFQTNLLALNAAVEAARAGQHGKGFAVVAEEVRNLAGRSAKAAQETAELIAGSVTLTAQGGQIADQTAAALGEIVSGITKVSTLIEEIATASNDQAHGIGQVNQGLGQIGQVTQQNTANAEESAAASEELSSQAAHLRSMLSRFRLNQSSQMQPIVQAFSSTHANDFSAWDDNPPRQPSKPLPQPKSSQPNDLIKWSERYATNISVIDMQHKRLIDLINQLYLSMKNGGDKASVEKAVDGLLEYTRTHFSMEEDLMRKHDYPDFAAHKELHDQFVKQAQSYREKIKKDERLTPADVFHFLKGWLIDHIEKKDRDGYGPYIADNGTATSTAQSQTADEFWG